MVRMVLRDIGDAIDLTDVDNLALLDLQQKSGHLDKLIVTLILRN